MTQVRIVLCFMSFCALGCTKYQDATIGARTHNPDGGASTADASDAEDADGGHEEDERDDGGHRDDEGHHEEDDEVHAADAGESGA